MFAWLRSTAPVVLGWLGVTMTAVAAGAAQQPATGLISRLAPLERELGAGRKPATAELEPYRIFESEWGWLVVEDSTLAAPAISCLRSSIARFERIFDKSVGRGVLVITDDGSALATETYDALAKGAGAQWSFTQRLRPPSHRDAMLDHARHEIGHDWVRNAYQGQVKAVWLQETISELLQVDRHGGETRLPPGYAAKYFVPLDTLFTMANPANAVIASGGSAEAARFMIAIYAEFVSLSDFFLERSLDPTLYRSLAEHDAGGGNMAAWLRMNGSRYNLPTTVAELEAAWRAWRPLQHSTPADTTAP